jgi:hypothetical protein
MKDLRICGSCYNLVTATDNTVTCPRCKGDLEPEPADRLRKFIEHGTEPTKKGVKLNEAQDAASKVLGELQLLQLHLDQHHRDWQDCCDVCCQHETHGGY